MAQNKKLISVIIGLICFALVISGIFVSINSNLFEIPVIKLVLNVSDVDMDEYYDALDEYDDIIDDIDDDELEEFYDVTGIELDEFTEMITSPSINDMLELCTLVDTIDTDEIDIDGFNINDFDMTEEVQGIFAIIRAVIIAYGLFVALFSILGALLKKRVLTILAIVFSLGFFFALVSIIMGLLFIALSIVHIVVLSQMIKASAVPNNITANV